MPLALFKTYNTGANMHDSWTKQHNVLVPEKCVTEKFVIFSYW